MTVVDARNRDRLAEVAMAAVAIVLASIAGVLYGAGEVAAIGAIASGGLLAFGLVCLIARARWAMRVVLFLAVGWAPGVVMVWAIHHGLNGRVAAYLLLLGSTAVFGAIVRLPRLLPRYARVD